MWRITLQDRGSTGTRDQPVAYASRILSKAERGYSQLDKEELAMLFAVKKFHLCLYGRYFKIYTDQKPLLGLLSPEKATPIMASSRMQRWALTLLAYKYKLVYRPGRDNCNGDALSRLPLEASLETVPGDTICLMENLATTPVDVTKVKPLSFSFSRDQRLTQSINMSFFKKINQVWKAA